MTVKENISAYAWTKTRQIIMEKQVKNISYWQVFPFPNLSFSPITLLILYSFSIVYQKFGEKTKKTCFHKCWNALHNSSRLNPFWGNIFSNQCRWRQNTNSRWFKVTKLHHLEVTIRLSKGHAVTIPTGHSFYPELPPENEHMTLKIDGWKMKSSYQNWLPFAELPGYIYTFLLFWGWNNTSYPFIGGPCPSISIERLFHRPLPEVPGSFPMYISPFKLVNSPPAKGSQECLSSALEKQEAISYI